MDLMAVALVECDEVPARRIYFCEDVEQLDDGPIASCCFLCHANASEMIPLFASDGSELLLCCSYAKLVDGSLTAVQRVVDAIRKANGETGE